MSYLVWLLMVLNNEDLYCMGFSYFQGIGPHMYDMLVNTFGSSEQAYNAEAKQLKSLLGYVLSSRFILFRKNFSLKETYCQLEKKNITLISRNNKNYPQQLKRISDPPICIYIKGDFFSVDFSEQHIIAIVGTRKPTSYGMQLAHKFSFELSSFGMTVVSGLALGVDSIAHSGAISAKSKTIAVMGCGVDIIYPPANNLLYEQIVKESGIVLSEFPPGHTVKRGLFVARNRLISGLACGVIIIEGAQQSGSLITAKYALEQGKDVFAPPSPITSLMSYVPNMLLKQGAVLVTGIEDIIGEINYKKLSCSSCAVSLSGKEKQIIELLETEPILFDDLLVSVNTTPQLLSLGLSNLEIKGLIEKNAEGKYQLVLKD